MLLSMRFALMVGTSYVVVYQHWTFVHLAHVIHFCVFCKIWLESEEMVVLTLSISLGTLVVVTAQYVSAIGIAVTEAGLPTDLAYFNLNCFSKISG